MKPTPPGPRDVVYRSRIEIARVLGMLERGRRILAAGVAQGDSLFLTRILRVDPGHAFIVVAYGEEKAANSALLRQPAVTFLGSGSQARVEFTAAHPRDALFEDRAAVKLDFPEVLAELQRRRFPRYPVKADVSLRCVADSAGFVPFEARIADISRGGMGALVYEAGIRLAPGTILRRSRVAVPGHEAVEVDLEVRYATSVALPDGQWVNRAGVRFLAIDERIDALLRVFVADLDEAI